MLQRYKQYFSRDGTYDLNCFIYDCRLKINPRLAVAKIDSQRQSCFDRCDRMLLHYRFWKVWPASNAQLSLLFLDFRILHIVFCYSPHKRHFRFWPYRLCVRVGAIHTKKFVLLYPRARHEWFFFLQRTRVFYHLEDRILLHISVIKWKWKWHYTYQCDFLKNF